MEDNGRKKILVINGSPHREKSTTMVATRAFVAGMASVGDYAEETVDVSDLRITPCLGCLSCWGRTEGECIIRNDDIPALRDKIRASDVLIGSFPLYFFGIPGQMKVMCDRLLSLMNTYTGQTCPPGGPAHGFRFPKEGQKFVAVSACAYAETDAVYKPVIDQFDLIFGHENYTALFCPQLKTAVDKGGSRTERIKDRFFAAGAEFARTGTLSAETSASATRAPFSREIYKTILAGVWEREREEGRKS